MHISESILRNRRKYNAEKDRKGEKDSKGLSVEITAGYVRDKENWRKKIQAGIPEETKNRERIVYQIADLVEKGSSIQIAAKSVALDPENIKKFDYFTNNGADLSEIFVNWYTTYTKKNKRVMNHIKR